MIIFVGLINCNNLTVSTQDCHRSLIILQDELIFQVMSYRLHRLTSILDEGIQVKVDQLKE